MIYPENDYRAYLIHHGIKGQRWGVQNGPPYPLKISDHSASEKAAGWRDSLRSHKIDVDAKNYATARLKKSTFSNVEKWGKDPKHNILYVTGISGSGKSTVAEYMSKSKSMQYINLDSYLSPMSKASKRKYQNKSFNKLLDDSVPNWKNVIKEDGKLDYKIVDGIAKASEKFGKEQFKSGKNVIMEGVQIFDTTLYEDRKFYSDKPLIVVNTNSFISNLRGSARDSDNAFEAASLAIYRTKNTINTSKELSIFKNIVGVSGKKK